MLDPLLGRLGELDADVLVDCGRLDLGSPLGRLWEQSDRAVLAVRPRLADLQALATWLEGPAPQWGRLGLVTIGDGPFADTEIAEALGVEVLARLPWDPTAAEAMLSVPASSRQLRLAPLARAARTFADQLVKERERTRPAGDAVTAEPTSGVSLAVRSRVWKAFRPQATPAASIEWESVSQRRWHGDGRFVAGGRSADRGPGRTLGARAGTGRSRPPPARSGRRAGPRPPVDRRGPGAPGQRRARGPAPRCCRRPKRTSCPGPPSTPCSASAASSVSWTTRRSRTSTPTAATRCGSATPTAAGSRWSRSPAPTRSWRRCCAPRRLAPGSASAASTAARPACPCSCPTGRGCSR